MITGSMIYWITRLDCISVLLNFCIIVCIISIVILIPISLDDTSKAKLNFRRIAFIGGILLPFFTLFQVFIPTTKEMCAIIVIPKIINNEQVQKICPKVLDLANEWLDELQPKRRNKNGKE